jgi:hypothetical protein
MAQVPGEQGTVEEPMTDVDVDGRAYLERVMAEIDEEVHRRRASGDLPARVERELDELFLEFSPVAGRGGSLTEALRLVDGAAFIDPVVPLASDKSGGAVVKKGVRTLSLWYMGFVTHQVSQFASAVSRALHLVDEELLELRRQVDLQRVPPAPVVEVGWAHGAHSWWVAEAVKALSGTDGRVLHAAAGDGWLVRRLTGEGVDAYGVDPREGRVDRAELEGVDLREEGVLEHLRASRPATLGGVVLTGVVDGASAAERDALLALVADRLVPDATLVVHSLSPSGWASDDLPPEADLSPGHPLRAATWPSLLGACGFEVTVEHGPERTDYLVVATRHGVRPATTAR